MSDVAAMLEPHILQNCAFERLPPHIKQVGAGVRGMVVCDDSTGAANSERCRLGHTRNIAPQATLSRPNTSLYINATVMPPFTAYELTLTA